MTEYVERRVHDLIWRATAATSDLEAAIVDARNLIYMAGLHERDDAVGYVARLWLDNYGHNERKEHSGSSSTG